MRKLIKSAKWQISWAFLPIRSGIMRKQESYIPKMDPSNGYRYFTPADIYALLDVLFYRSMDIPVEEVRNIMNSYQHRDVKKLLEQKQEQVQARYGNSRCCWNVSAPPSRITGSWKKTWMYFQVRPIAFDDFCFMNPRRIIRRIFNNMIEQENQNPSQAVGSLIESGFYCSPRRQQVGNDPPVHSSPDAGEADRTIPGKRPAGERAQSGLHRIAFPFGAFAWSRCSRLRWIMLRGRAFSVKDEIFRTVDFLPITASRGRWIMWLYICRWINAKPLFLDIIKGKG